VKSSVEPLEGNRVKLYVEVDEAEFESAIEEAFRSIAREVKLPGFRNGKAPRRLLEARIGLGPAREQALRDAIPGYLTKAVLEHEVDLVATPSIEITGGQESGVVEFEAECEIRPEITVPGYGGLRVELDSPEVDDAAVDEAIRSQLRAHGTLADIDEPAVDGHYLTLDMRATRDGEELSGLNIEDWSYELGQGWVTDDFDEQLRGARPGSVLEFTSTPKGLGDPADFSVTVTAVKGLVLPEPDDAWVEENIGDVTTVEEWRESIRERLGEGRLDRIRQTVVSRVVDSLVELVEIDAPESMVNAEVQGRLQNLARQFEAQGMDLSAWMSATGQSAEDLIGNMRDQALTAVRADLALRAVAVAEDIEVTGDDLEAEYLRLAMQFGETADRVRAAYERNGGVPDLMASVRKSKALDWLLHNVEMVDGDGRTLDRDLILGHDHDHDEESDPGDDVPAGESSDEGEEA
jgi:trigger factor